MTPDDPFMAKARELYAIFGDNTQILAIARALREAHAAGLREAASMAEEYGPLEHFGEFAKLARLIRVCAKEVEKA